ncbi:MAG: protein FdrA [Egibacteraceae bacterium]
MSTQRLQVQPESYTDSVRLMSARRSMLDIDGVSFAAAVMGTEANRSELRDRDFDADELSGTGANDLVLAVTADSDEVATEAITAGESALSGGAGGGVELGQERPARTLEQGVEQLTDPNVALISVPGEYAALEAHKALTAGLHVLLFSSGVSPEAEIELKERGVELGLLVMGPDAGTAMLGGVGLGFANVVEPGPVGVVAAAGTGAQEVMTLLDRWGAGPSHVIGAGGRDPSSDVAGRMLELGLRTLQDDDATEILLIVSKPPAPEIAASLVEGLQEKPVVAAFIGLDDRELSVPDDVRLVTTLEKAALACLEVLGRPTPDPAEGLAEVAATAADGLSEGRRSLRGLFSGGTLCYETMVIASQRLGPVHSNTPLEEDWSPPAPDDGHICLDLGAEEFTQGRPHPMIDPEPRVEQLLEHGRNPACAVVLFDVVLGHGAHSDPASVLAPACEEITGQDDGPAVVAYVLGTSADPQGLEEQRQALRDAGCLVAPTNARAALLATAIAARQPEIAESPA